MLVPYAFTAIAAAAAAVPHGHAAHQQTLQPHKVNKKAPASVHMPTLPPIYYINLAANTDRREYMERKLASVPTSSVTRVEAVDTDDVERNLADGKLQLAEGLTVLPSNNTDPGEHIAGAYKLSEYACTGSHLRAIKTAYDAGHQLALIMEDDVSFDLMPFWDATLQDLAIGAPPDWEILQLHTNNPTFYLEQGLQLLSQRLRADKNFDSCGSGVGDEMYVRYRIGHWGTAAYLINRFGMEALLKATSEGTRMLEPAAADELIFMEANTYSLQRPIFITGDFNSDVATAAADDNDGTDGPTNALISEFYKLKTERRSRLNAEQQQMAARNCQPRRAARLSVALIVTTTTDDEDMRRAARNARALGPLERVQWVYAINSIDNQAATWNAARPTFARAGVHLVAMDSGREMPRFMPKLVGQVRLFDHLEKMVPTDYVWMMDGDISFAPTNLPSVVNALITFPMPVISQSTVELVDPNSAAGVDAAAGARPSDGQWFEALNRQLNGTACSAELWNQYRHVRHKVEALQVGVMGTAPQYGPPPTKIATNVYVARKLPLPAIESQAPLVATDFMRWYLPTLTHVSELQNAAGSDWGSDSMWCSAAVRYINEGSPTIGSRLSFFARPDPTRADSAKWVHAKATTDRDPCVLLADISVGHEDTHTIDQDAAFIKAGQTLTKKLEEEEPDYLSNDALNTWWTQHATCDSLVKQRNPVADYRKFIYDNPTYTTMHGTAKAFEKLKEQSNSSTPQVAGRGAQPDRREARAHGAQAHWARAWAASAAAKSGSKP